MRSIGSTVISITLTCKDKEEARKIVKSLLEKKLIACANIVMVNSLYWWKGKMVDEQEAMVFIKTSREKRDEVVDEIKKLHSYEVVGITIHDAETTEECLEWIEKL